MVIDWRYDISGSPIFRENQEMNKEIIPVAEDQKIGKITSYRKSESGDKSPVTGKSESGDKPTYRFSRCGQSVR